ncbi:AMP-binding protein [Pseudonocardia alaniniphila]|uniref:AMP-binding protein n=1 Tax=Pseudonocardia alaniniphila TaxID=75291 RepID=A0ABS9TNA0_9PSEU|nr:AMP-binding protein [Pseudonocardia alaniniphila]MCH6170024.1 AMP-binding protein [Pseudonocardia alaniniphila]
MRATEYRSSGIWRSSGPIGDLRQWRVETPDAIAIRAHRSGGPQRQISYGEYAGHVERFAGALVELGVRPGEVVALQLPNWWQAGALMLAAARVGAVLTLIPPNIRSRELERVLAGTDASLCVTADEWTGFDHAAAVREMAPRLPQLRTRVVLGRPAGGDEIGFTSFFEDTPWERRHPVALEDAQEDPDRVAVVCFTSGTSGEPKGILHTWNTLHATVAQLVEIDGGGPGEALFTPITIVHLFGVVYSVLTPLLTGACSVLLDAWSGETGLAVLAESGATQFTATPLHFFDLVAAAGTGALALPALRVLFAAGTTIPKQLVTEVRDALGVPLRAEYGMTEIGLGTSTRADDPVDWAAHSDGRPGSATEIDVRSNTVVTPDQPGRLFVRGPGVCLASVGRDSGKVTVIADHDDGWFDTGDLAAPDGRGGIRLAGRVGDRIGGSAMIPVTDVESLLLSHPGVTDVALVGYPDGKGGELACAVIRPATTPPVGLEELRVYLSDQRMTDFYLPSRLELLPQLPRNTIGKVRKELLRRWLRGEADLTDA